MVDDLSGLGPQGFERLSQALAVRVLGAGVDVFGDGPDGGREASFDGRLTYPNSAESWDGFGVLQAKYKTKITGTVSDTTWLRRQVTAELDAWSDPSKKRVVNGRLPKFLIFVTNVPLSAVPGRGGKDRIDTLIRSYATTLGLKDWAVWDGTKISTLLDSYPDVRQAFSALITSNEVLAAMQAHLTAPPPRVDVVLAPPHVRPGQPGHEAAFQPVYDAAGGADCLGEAMGEVREEGPGWVQHFSGGPQGEPAVLVALYGKPVGALARVVWNELCAVGGGLPNSGTVGVGFPVADRSDQSPFIGSASPSVELAGGQWGWSGRGRLVRRAGNRPVWQPEIVFDSEATLDKDSWTSLTDKRDLRLRVAGRIPLAAQDWRITDAGRARMLTALEQTGIAEVFHRVAGRYGLDTTGADWQEIGEPDGQNNSRCSAYHLTAAGADERPAVSMCLWFVLPAGRATELRSTVDLRIDFSAVDPSAAPTGPVQIPSYLRVTLTELIEFFTYAWQVTAMALPLSATEDLSQAEPAGAPRLELYIQNEHPEMGGTQRTARTLDMVDLSSFGAPRSSQIRDLSVAVTTPLGLQAAEIEPFVNQALGRMATDVGFAARPSGTK